ncbi:hypothetical protein HPULCUR_005605 [Helicostylum pulchrum]|uniref:Uncharacterized protein n=1 Tax=Helicostylum pulchrum TaxID=562976 RepID=A0ABP9Y0U4_9FUNG
MDDEDLIMEEGGEEDEDQDRYNNTGKSVYTDDYSDQTNTSHFGKNPRDFSRFDMSAGSPLGWNEAIDEKGETVALMMHLEKTIVHQKFFNHFDDDFDEDDLA